MTQPGTSRLDHLLQKNIQEDDIPPRPQIIDRIRSEIMRNDPDLRLVAELINRDVALAAGLIRTANSPFFGHARHARSVMEAVSMLGLDVTTRAITTICLRTAFPECGHYERFWHASAQIAALSAWLSKRLAPTKIRIDDAYTFGLFRDAGIVILMRRYPKYTQILGAANENREMRFTAVEQEQLPTDHCMLGSLMAQNWWLPEDTCQAIRHHHDLNRLDADTADLNETSRLLIALAQTSEYLVQQITGGSQTQEWFKLGASCQQQLALNDVTLAECLADAREILESID